ncbi:MAG: alpha/beta fold hydrolase [Myxococcota bacterium]
MWNHGFSLLLAVAAGPDLPRQAALGFEFSPRPRLQVQSVVADSPAARAGLRVGDVIQRVNGVRFVKPYEGRDRLRRLDGDRAATLTVLRSGGTKSIRFTPRPRAPERLDGFETELGVVTSEDGARLRTYVSVPATVGRRPALFFVQWVSCGTIEIEPGAPTTDMLVDVARARNMVILRMERSSNGDSEGPGCHALDFDTEVAHYRAAFDALVRHPRVDPSRVFVWGSSLGSVVAPFVVERKRIAGLIVGGGGALSYYERMITFDRIRLERAGDPTSLQAEMRRRIRFHDQYLLGGRNPADIERSERDLKGVWSRILGTGDGVHYGRPYAYHRQAAAKNVLAQWLKIEAPVLVMYNEFDQFEAEHGHRLIARTLERLRPGQATYVRHARMGHSYWLYPDEYAAHGWDRSRRVSGASIGTSTVLRWLAATSPRDR